MGKSWKVVLALGVGYFLGRSHKTRLALFLAAGAATGGFGSAARRVVTSESLGKLSPDFGQVVDSLKGDLADAGKAAAKAAISSKLDAVADTLHDRTQALRGQAAPDGGRADVKTEADVKPEADVKTETGGPDGRQERRRRPEEDYSSDRDRPQRAPRPRPSDDSAAPRPGRPSRPAHRQPASSRTGRPASGHRGGGD